MSPHTCLPLLTCSLMSPSCHCVVCNGLEKKQVSETPRPLTLPRANSEERDIGPPQTPVVTRHRLCHTIDLALTFLLCLPCATHNSPA